MSLDINKLPEHPTMEMAVQRINKVGMQFGTLYTSSRNLKQMVFDVTYREIRLSLQTDPRVFALPQGWEIRKNWHFDSNRVATFVTYSIIAPHNFVWRSEFLNGFSELSKEMLCLISGYLQLGEGFNYRNYCSYIFGYGLKFLPLVIEPRHFCLNVYNPTFERVRESVQIAKELFPQAEKLISQISPSFFPSYALVRLDEIASAFPSWLIAEIHQYETVVGECIGKRYLFGS